MTQVHRTVPHVTGRQDRIRLVSEAVVSSYIHDISARTAPDRRGTREVRAAMRSGRASPRREVRRGSVRR
jgi:hypothetical protein